MALKQERNSMTLQECRDKAAFLLAKWYFAHEHEVILGPAIKSLTETVAWGIFEAIATEHENDSPPPEGCRGGLQTGRTHP
jgi:hypothetical protein